MKASLALELADTTMLQSRNDTLHTNYCVFILGAP